MQISEIFFRGSALVLRDVDGSEVTMPVQSAEKLLTWLRAHAGELQDLVRKGNAESDTAYKYENIGNDQ
jgi:hypothetical protein